MNEFDKKAQAVEAVFNHIDFLIEQGKPRSEAIDHTAHRFGIQRHKLVALLNDRDAGWIGPTPRIHGK